jgi:hypothetical protein
MEPRHRAGITTRILVAILAGALALALWTAWDSGDPIFSVENTNDSGKGSLRQAILDANKKSGADAIRFAIPGQGVHTIAPLTALPDITDPVVIDGFTQSGAHPNTRPAGSNAVIRIELSGQNLSGTEAGLRVRSSGSTIRGLAINRFGGAQIELRSARNVVAGNYIGPRPAGGAGYRKASAGIGVDVWDRGNRVGGTAPAERNLISANGSDGVRLSSAFADGNLVQGNLIGTDASGTEDLGNMGSGVALDGADQSVIGGIRPDTAANKIAFNHGDGVTVSSGEGNAIRGNAIYANAGLGIDLGPDGVTANDSGDWDGGGNRLQNFPVIRGVTFASGQTTIRGKLDSAASQTFDIDLYRSRSASGAEPEARRYLGSTRVKTDRSGGATFALVVGGRVARRHLTATATPLRTLDTSEFGAAKPEITPDAAAWDGDFDEGGSLLDQYGGAEDCDGGACDAGDISDVQINTDPTYVYDGAWSARFQLQGDPSANVGKERAELRGMEHSGTSDPLNFYAGDDSRIVAHFKFASLPDHDGGRAIIHQNRLPGAERGGPPLAVFIDDNVRLRLKPNPTAAEASCIAVAVNDIPLNEWIRLVVAVSWRTDASGSASLSFRSTQSSWGGECRLTNVQTIGTTVTVDCPKGEHVCGLNSKFGLYRDETADGAYDELADFYLDGVCQSVDVTSECPAAVGPALLAANR